MTQQFARKPLPSDGWLNNYSIEGSLRKILDQFEGCPGPCDRTDLEHWEKPTTATIAEEYNRVAHLIRRSEFGSDRDHEDAMAVGLYTDESFVYWLMNAWANDTSADREYGLRHVGPFMWRLAEALPRCCDRYNGEAVRVLKAGLNFLSFASFARGSKTNNAFIQDPSVVLYCPNIEGFDVDRYSMMRLTGGRPENEVLCLPSRSFRVSQRPMQAQSIVTVYIAAVRSDTTATSCVVGTAGCSIKSLEPHDVREGKIRPGDDVHDGKREPGDGAHEGKKMPGGVVHEGKIKSDDGKRERFRLLCRSFIFSACLALAISVALAIACGGLGWSRKADADSPRNAPNKTLPFCELQSTPNIADFFLFAHADCVTIERTTNSSIEDLLRWFASRSEHEAEKVALAARQKQEEARRQASVVSTREETKVDVVSSRKQPVYRTHRCVVSCGGHSQLWGGVFDKPDMYSDVQVLRYEDAFVTKQKYVRLVETLGSGKEVFGEWQRSGSAWEEYDLF